MRLLALAFGVAEAGDQRLAVQHHGGVGGEHQVGLAPTAGTRRTVAPLSSSAWRRAVEPARASRRRPAGSALQASGFIHGLIA